MRIVDVTDANIGLIQAFLERYPETSLFLLSNLRAFGPRIGESVYSGDVRALVDDSGICAVFCLTRGGNLIAQAAGHAELAQQIVQACEREPIEVRGVLAEWNVASAIWGVLCARRQIRATLVSKEILYRLSLSDVIPTEGSTDRRVRMLRPDDHAQWDNLTVAFAKELRLPVQGQPDERRTAFARSAGLGHWWGACEGDRLVSVAGFNALHRSIAQLGGVFTAPEWRRRGLSRAVMTALIRDSVTTHHLETLFLFTGEHDRAARSLYESLGFVNFGHFGLFFGEST